jgi:hypothetical protein
MRRQKVSFAEMPFFDAFDNGIDDLEILRRKRVFSDPDDIVYIF